MPESSSQDASASARLLRHSGSVTPKRRPEDFKALREAFEEGVAEEVMFKLAQEDRC
jgi:hypothetical protein